MALYFYQAFSKEGKKITGHIDASTLMAARDQLVKIGIFPTKIELASEVAQKESLFKRIFQRGVGLREKIFFTKQLSILLKSGVPLVQALELLAEQSEGKLRSIVVELKDGIKEGRSLADGLQKYSAIFGTIFIQLVRAGEATGKLEVILDRLTSYLETQEETKKKVSAALRYPMIQLIVIFLVVIGLLTLVIPRMQNIFKDLGAALPLPTKILVSSSNFFLNYYIIITIVLVLLYVIFRIWKNTPGGSYTVDRIKLKLPLVGYFAKTNAIVQFSRTLGMLLESGVNLAEALNIVVKIIDNKVLANALEEAKENIIKQGKIAQYLKETELFPPVAIYLINTGEQSGELDTMLLTVAQNYESEVKDAADNLTTLLNPIMLIVMAAVVGFVILAVMMPVQEIQRKAMEMSAKLSK